MEICVCVVLHKASTQTAAQLQIDASCRVRRQFNYDRLRGVVRTYLEAARSSYQGGPRYESNPNTSGGAHGRLHCICSLQRCPCGDGCTSQLLLVRHGLPDGNPVLSLVEHQPIALPLGICQGGILIGLWASGLGAATCPSSSRSATTIRSPGESFAIGCSGLGGVDRNATFRELQGDLV
eukprot:4210956-Amphidinium_carterae.1